MIVFPCQVCQTPLCAEEAQAGQLVRCPTCSSSLRVPAAGANKPPSPVANAPRTRPGGAASGDAGRDYSAFAGLRSGGRRYGFNCPYCSSRLEAAEAMAAQEGQCPTCGNQITIPILDRYGRLIDPKTREIIRQDPHPVHAYAAAGDRAPRILRLKDGRQVIRCPRCTAESPITANNCKSCGMPFTMEGTTIEAAGASNGFCIASLVLGIIGIPAGCSVVIPLIAIVFGIVGLTQVGGGQGGGRGMAIAGIICGCIGLLIAAVSYL